MEEICQVNDVLAKVVNLLSLTDQLHAALHGEPPHKSPLTLKAEAAREIVSKWLQRVEEKHEKELA